ncbi:hypothetical protein TRIUR3_26062 [Triticum urartu]|uniref:Uncharacterized protein n=1 Tax=Triticum urartu TaxID=4572 RepID=M7ZMR3_TRIUA|nr:hypothetical protein TRIUR3_26062 [Triticum urartu]
MALVSAPAPAAVWTAVSPPAEANGSSDRKKKSVPPLFTLFGKIRVSPPISSFVIVCVLLLGHSVLNYVAVTHVITRLFMVFNRIHHQACLCKLFDQQRVVKIQRYKSCSNMTWNLQDTKLIFLEENALAKSQAALRNTVTAIREGRDAPSTVNAMIVKTHMGKKCLQLAIWCYVGVILDGKSILAAPTPTPNERNGAEVISSDDDDDDEDDYYMNRPLSPIPPSPVSRESSFQQETLVGVEVHTVNGHLYPKPLTQVRPESWQLSRRPAEEARGDQWRYMRRPSEDGTSDAMEGHADPKFHHQRDSNNKQRESHADNRFSIPRCIEVMNGMADLSPVDKSLAPDVFLDPSNREIFLSLSVDIRTMWLKRKMRSLV